MDYGTVAQSQDSSQRAPGDPRVLLYSHRSLERTPWFVSQYEFEDIISSLDRVRMVAPTGSKPLGRGVRRVLRAVRDRSRKARGGWDVPPVEPAQVQGEYDLFFATFHFADQLRHLEQLHGWRKQCRVAICFILELWSTYVERDKRYLPLLDQFDHVFLVNRGSMELVARYTSAPLSFMPTAVDTMLFAPAPEAPERVIDFYNFGRKSPVTHAALMQLMRRNERTYVYDTLRGTMLDYREHRFLVASLMQRSRYFLAYRIGDTAERQSRTGGEDALSTRYFEGAASGAVLLGSSPRCEEYAECFDWADAVIEIPYDAADIGTIVAALEEQPERLAAARYQNVTNSLKRHDWLYRWQQVLDAAGLPPTPEMKLRAERLDVLARCVPGGTPQKIALRQ